MVAEKVVAKLLARGFERAVARMVASFASSVQSVRVPAEGRIRNITDSSEPDHRGPVSFAADICDCMLGTELLS